MIAAKLLVRQEDNMWHVSEPAMAVAANEGAVRSKLLTSPWESLLELGRDALPPQIPDLRPQVPHPPAKIVVRVRTTGLDWPEYQFYGLVAVEEPAVEPEPAEDTSEETEPEPSAGETATPPETPEPAA